MTELAPCWTCTLPSIVAPLMRSKALGEPCLAVTLPVTCVPVRKQAAPAGTIRLPLTVTAPSAPVQVVSPAAAMPAVKSAAATLTSAASANTVLLITLPISPCGRRNCTERPCYKECVTEVT
jgi:hypothetical protein